MAGLCLLLVPAAAGAQNREHQQIVADLRMLHEQLQQLKLTVNTLIEQLAATNTRLDAQGDATRKDFADLRVLVNQLTGDMSTLRENLYDNTTRISKLTQELEAIRTGLGSVNQLLTQIVALLSAPPVDPNAEPGERGAGRGVPPPVTPPTNTAGTPPTDPDPAIPPPPTQPRLQAPEGVSSPTTYLNSASGFYFAGQFDLAVEAFTDFLERFPDSPDAAEAQFFIGEAHYASHRYREAQAAYAIVIGKYKGSPRVPDAYYKQGLAYEQLGEKPEAIKNYELLRKTFPDSTAGGHATQALMRLGIIKD
jgi:tol-pal system protein YbgF